MFRAFVAIVWVHKLRIKMSASKKTDRLPINLIELCREVRMSSDFELYHRANQSRIKDGECWVKLWNGVELEASDTRLYEDHGVSNVVTTLWVSDPRANLDTEWTDIWRGNAVLTKKSDESGKAEASDDEGEDVEDVEDEDGDDDDGECKGCETIDVDAERAANKRTSNDWSPPHDPNITMEVVLDKNGNAVGLAW